MAAAADQTYWILDKQQLEAMVSPRGHDIVDRLTADGPMSIKELAQQIGCQPSSLYHHIAKLLRVGLVVDAGSRVVRRRREQLYDTPAPRMRLARALAEGKHPEIFEEIVNSLTRQMARDFGAGSAFAGKIAEGDVRNLGFGRLIGRPDATQLANINACLAQINEILWSSSHEDAQPISVGWVMAPLN